VVSGEEGEKGVAYGLLTSVLVNAIQEQQEIIENLKASNTQLQARAKDVDALKVENTEMKAEIENIKAMLGMNNEIAKNK